ncbi:MAG TPA: hypothetical protein DCR21_03995 [Succinivibrionaceae bacterium]|nr:hypothetical protein [Succinivibrionaceae bacterium]
MKKLIAVITVALAFCLFSSYHSISANENALPIAKIEIPEVNKENCTNNKGLDEIIAQLNQAKANKVQIEEKNLNEIKKFSEKCVVLIKQY